VTTAADFLTELRRGLTRCELRHGAILIGLSGGADSVALLRGLLELRGEFEVTVSAAHLNHQLRGADSAADAAWVADLCQRLQVPVRIGTAAGLTAFQGGSPGMPPGVEEAARQARHRFLDQTAAELDCEWIATAHTADDQVETVLHHIFRGTGLAGLRGIPAVRQTGGGLRLAHPMLSVRRISVEAYLTHLRQDFRTDATNADTGPTRNWLRHKMLPDLRERYGASVDGSIRRLSEQAASVESTLAQIATELLERAILDVQATAVRLDATMLRDEPPMLVSEAFRTLWQRQGWPRQEMGFREWNQLARVATTGGDIHLPGSIRARQNPPGLMILEKTNR
jgi:tRNA(Ile)-lysidine synthase